jgi:CAAX protease family protein
VLLILVLVGVASVRRDGGLQALSYPFAAALVAAVGEETLMRGVLFRIVERSLGSWIALALSAALFGALHGFNAGATVLSSIAIALEAGVLLAAAYMCSRRLWLPIGVHTGWNFTEGGVFGASVSGGQEHGMLASVFRGPDLLTGGAFGPEASLVAVVVCLALGVAFIVLAVRRGRVLAPYWRARRAAGAPA